LLPKFRLSVIPFVAYYGGAETLTFYEGETPLSLFTARISTDMFIIKDSLPSSELKLMFRLDNYDEVKDEYNSILEAMGVKDLMGATVS